MATAVKTRKNLQFDTTADYRQLVSPALFDRLVNRIVKDDEVEKALAERIMESALGFLYLVAAEPEGRFSPSPMVDLGWHAFILHTRDYAAFCDKVKGSFIHHEPTEEAADISRTIAALHRHGLGVDEMLWTSAACCGEGGGGCR